MRGSFLWRRTILIALIVLGAAGCDQTTKVWARHTLQHDSVEVFDGLVQLVLAENRGGFLSLGDEFPAHVRTIIFTTGVLAGLVIATAWLLLRHGGSRIETVALSLIIGGGLGNLIDRAMRSGAVTDFIVTRLGPLRTGVFNVADVCVTTGVLLLALTMARRKALR